MCNRSSASVCLMLVVVAVLAGSSATGQVPQRMNYQVMLTDASGQPLPGSHGLIFRIYDQESEGTLLWSEPQVLVANSIGVVSAVLGSILPIDIAFDGPCWLEVEVDSELVTSRRQLVSSPYAFRANDSDNLAGVPATGYATCATLAASGTVNDPSNPVDWTMLKNVPAGFADEVDDSGGSGDGHSLDAADGDPTDVVYVSNAGEVQVADDLSVGDTLGIGSSSQDGTLTLHRNGTSNPIVWAYDIGDLGGCLRLRDANGFTHTAIEPDDDGQGGRLEIKRNSGGADGFLVDANYLGSGTPYVAVTGPGSFAAFAMGYSGDYSVQLPDDAVSAAETLNEPGVASDTGIHGSLDGSLETLISRTITAPSDGYALVIASCAVDVSHTQTIDSYADFGVSDSPSALPANQDLGVFVVGMLPSGLRTFPVTAHGIFEVTTGDNTFYFLGQENSGTVLVNDLQLSVIFFPTAYGDVTPTLAGMHNASDEPVSPAMDMDPVAPAARQAEVPTLDPVRIERELARMQSELDDIRQELADQTR